VICGGVSQEKSSSLPKSKMKIFNIILIK